MNATPDLIVFDPAEQEELIKAISAEFGAPSLQELPESTGLITLSYNGHVLVPGFQVRGGEPDRDVVAAVAVLSAVMTGWEIAAWMISNNGLLDGARPVDLPREKLLDAARLELGEGAVNATPEHLTPVRAGRGFAHLPPLVDHYSSTELSVCESSSAEGPHLWLTLKGPDSSGNDPAHQPAAEIAMHLSAELAWQLAEQIALSLRDHYQGNALPARVRAAWEQWLPLTMPDETELAPDGPSGLPTATWKVDSVTRLRHLVDDTNQTACKSSQAGGWLPGYATSEECSLCAERTQLYRVVGP